MSFEAKKIYQIYKSSQDIPNLINNLQRSSFYFIDFLQQYEYIKVIGQGVYDNIQVKQYTKKNGRKNYAVRSYKYHVDQKIDDLLEFFLETNTQEKIINSIECPFIIGMKGIFVEQVDDVLYLNMILDFGQGNLDQLSQQISKDNMQNLEFEQLIKIFQQQLIALKMCEQHQITHNNIKPCNIIYKKNKKNEYTSFLTDFKVTSQNEYFYQSIYDAVGDNIQYLSSEYLYAYTQQQYENNDIKYLYKSDIYSLGLSMLALASSNNQFQRNYENMENPLEYDSNDIGQEDWDYITDIEQMFDQVKEKYKQQSTIDVENFIDIIKMCLCYNPQYRQSSQEILNQLNEKFEKMLPLHEERIKKLVDSNYLSKSLKWFAFIVVILLVGHQISYINVFTQIYGIPVLEVDYKDGTYTGNVQGNYKHGEGIYEFKNGDKYTGHYKNNQRSGQGIFEYKNGNVYKGEFKYNKKNGNGVFEWKDGNRYSGEFVDDKMHGQGIMEFLSGNVYEGEFVKDKMHGQGTMVFKSGNKYTGQFQDDLIHGQGIYEYKNGKVEKGTWVKGQKV